MEEGKAQRSEKINESDFLIQWGNRKRLRCVKIKEPENLTNKSIFSGKKKITSRVDRQVVTAEKEKEKEKEKDKDSSSPQAQGHKSTTLPMINRKSSVMLPDKEDRYYMTRGSLGMDEKVMVDHTGGDDKGQLHWPKLFVSLSNKEKEEDFMAMKGCKPPQRPKKRPKLLQKSLLLVMPGTWLSDLCQERYEVREKKVSKKRPRGLKAMGSVDSDSE